MRNKQTRISKSTYRCVFIILSLVNLFLIVSCITTGLPKPGEKSKSLLVICTDMEISGTFRRFSYMKLAIRGIDKPIDILPSRKYVIVSDLPPGTYTTASITEHPTTEGGYIRYNTSEKPEPQTFEVPFKLEFGKITYFPALFVYICKEKPGGVSTGWRIDKVTPEIMVKRTLLLKKSKNGEDWDIQ